MAQVLKAFFVGGVMGVVTHAFLVFYGMVLPLEMLAMHLDITFTLVSLGVITLIIYPSGLFKKIQDWGGWGMMLTFSGLAGAVAMAFQGVKAHTGSSAKAVLEGFKLVFTIVGIGAVPIIIVMLFVAYIL